MKFRKIEKVLNKSKNLFLGEIERLCNLKIKHIEYARIALEQWVRELGPLPQSKGRVLITAVRNYTWIEWAAYCAVVIRKMGFETTLLYKASEVKRLYNEPAYFNFWKGIEKIPGIKLINIETLAYDENEYKKYLLQCQKASVAALAYDFHIESADIIDHPELYGAQLQLLQTEMAQNGARLFQLFQTEKYYQFICYSGIIRDTSMLLQAALDAGQESVCVEGWAWREGHMIYNFNAPSLEYNVKGWMNYFGEWNEEKEKEMSQYFKFLDGFKQDSDWLNNFYMVQRAKVGEELPDYIQKFVEGNQKVFLMACNVIGDSSLLNRETIFRSHQEFIIKTVEYFAQRPDLKLIIRIHPAEEWVTSKVKIKLGSFSKKLAKEYSNILVIDSDEKLNTFSLIPFTHTGLVWITSAGVDMVVRGVPVISAALPKYHGLGIVDEPKSINEYFALLDTYSTADKRPNAQQIQKAKEYLYLVFKGFSFEATGRGFFATSCKYGQMPSQREHDEFYQIILKLKPSPDRII